MRILLDTHVFLWFALNDSRLSRDWLRRIKDSENDIFLSIASLWEIAIKSGLEKLILHAPFTEFVERNVAEERITILQASIDHFATVQKLPQYHRDPFDRLIIAQRLRSRFPS